MESTQPVPAATSARSSPTLIALLSAISLASDLFMVPAFAMIPALPMVFFPLFQTTLGCALAQGCLLAAWLALGDQPFWQRFLRHWIVAAVLYLVWAAGLAVTQPSQFRQLSLTVGLSVPLLSIAAQLPLWLARQIFGWRLIRSAASRATPKSSDPAGTPLRSFTTGGTSQRSSASGGTSLKSSEGRSGGTSLRYSEGRAESYQDAVCRDQRSEPNAAPPAPLSIRDLLTATMVVALALGLARQAPSPDGKPIGMLWALMFAVATTVSTLTLLPVSPLLMQTPRFARGALFASLYATFWIALPWLIILIAWSQGLFPPPPLPVLIGLTCLILSFAATIILAAATARTRGYRLTSGSYSGFAYTPSSINDARKAAR